MDFELTFTPEIEAFRDQVSRWLDEHAPALIHSSDPRDYDDDDRRKRSDLRRDLGHRGWLYPLAPKQYGGGGLSLDHAIVITQELERRDIYGLTDLGGRSAGACIRVWGTDEQKREFLPPILQGEMTSWLLLTEPQGGSDLASTRTSAIRDGDDYLVNGQKVFVGDDGHPDQFWTIVNSDPTGPRHQNLSYLLIPANLPGITIQPLYLLSSVTQNEHPNLHKCSVFFDDVRVPAYRRVGEENEGWRVATTNMELEHGGEGDITADRMLERLIEVLKELEWDGRPLLEDPEVKELLGEVLQDREVERLFGLRNYWMRHAGVKMSHEGAQLSYWRKGHVLRFVRRIQDMLGFYAITRDPKYALAQGFLELVQRSCFVTVHAGGGYNIQATIVARRLGIGRGAREEAGVLPS